MSQKTFKNVTQLEDNVWDCLVGCQEINEMMDNQTVYYNKIMSNMLEKNDAETLGINDEYVNKIYEDLKNGLDNYYMIMNLNKKEDIALFANGQLNLNYKVLYHMYGFEVYFATDRIAKENLTGNIHLIICNLDLNEVEEKKDFLLSFCK